MSEDGDEVFTLSDVSVQSVVHSGAQCNVIPTTLYEKTTKDYDRQFVTPMTSIVAINSGVWW